MRFGCRLSPTRRPDDLSGHHVAGDARFVVDGINVWPGADADGRLCDHAGVVCDIYAAIAEHV
jgi:hypothetical protein